LPPWKCLPAGCSTCFAGKVSCHTTAACEFSYCDSHL
jgi:hypothetical protein